MDWIKIGGWLGLLTVAIGAFGAHGLQERLQATGYEDQFRTGVLYQMFHVAGLLLVGLILRQATARGEADLWLRLAPWGFVLGILLFSGSLYALALTGSKGFGAVTPIGGLLFMGGWLGLALSCLPGR